MSTKQYNSKGQLHGICQFKAWAILYDNGIPISATLNDGTVIKSDKNTEITNYVITFKNDNGGFHREDGPAFIWSDGTKEWYFNDKRHRENGPAMILSDGYKEWHLNGKYYGEGKGEDPPEEYLQALVSKGVIKHPNAFKRGSDDSQ